MKQKETKELSEVPGLVLGPGVIQAQFCPGTMFLLLTSLNTPILPASLSLPFSMSEIGLGDRQSDRLALKSHDLYTGDYVTTKPGHLRVKGGATSNYAVLTGINQNCSR